MKNINKYIVIVGASGSGKSTLVNLLVQERPDLFKHAITYTTRAPRDNEINGKDYFFIDMGKFARLEISEYFIEVEDYLGEKYGLDKNFLAQSGMKIPIVLLTNSSAKSLKRKMSGGFYIYIEQINKGILLDNIQKRSSISSRELELRLNDCLSAIDYSDYNYVLKLNQDIEEQYLDLIPILIDYINN